MFESAPRLTRAAAVRLLDEAARGRVLVVGDAMLDRYVDGQVRRISPEAPVPVVRVRGERAALGGAGNVAAGVVALGGTARLAGVVGEDTAGRSLRSLAREVGVEAGGLVTDRGRPTTVKTRILSRSQQMIRVDRESDTPLDEAVRQRLLDRILESVESWADVVALVDYDKGVLSGGVGRTVLEVAREHAVLSVVDPKLRDFFDYAGAFIFKPNDRELAAAQGAERPPTEEGELRALRRKLECRHLLVTLGERGMVLVGDEEEGMVRIPSRAREVYDVSGAGDTVTATLSVALVARPSLPLAAALANEAAGLEVSRLGAVPVTRDELLNSLESRDSEGKAG